MAAESQASPRSWSVDLWRLLGLVALLSYACWRLSAWPWQPSGWLLVAVVVYLCGHVLRGLRLFLLLYDGKVGPIRIGQVHLHSAAVSLLTPWKLGELYRIMLIDGEVHRFSRALLTVWLERILDVLAIVVLFLVLGGVDGLLYAGAGIFLLLSFFAFLVLPEGLRLVQRYLIIRGDSRRNLSLLRLMEHLHDALHVSAHVLRTRWAAVGWLTVLVWLCECLSMTAALHGFGDAALGELGTWLRTTLSSLAAWDHEGLRAAGLAFARYRLLTVDALVAVVLGITALQALHRLFGRTPR